jgi:hypothetical protein
VKDESSFSIRRMKFWMSGKVFSKKFTYKWQMNFGGGNSVLEDAWATYQPSRANFRGYFTQKAVRIFVILDVGVWNRAFPVALPPL